MLNLFVTPAPVFTGINSSRAWPALDAGNPRSLMTGSLFSQGQVWIPVCTGMTGPIEVCQ
jgi:hypothetical protein